MFADPAWTFTAEGLPKYEQSGFAWGVIAVGDNNYSHIGEVDASSLAGPLPQRTAMNAMFEMGFARSMYDPEAIPRSYAFTGLDGITRLTQARIPENGIEDHGGEWSVKLEAVGTMLGEEFTVYFRDTEAPDPAAFVERFNAEATSLTPNTGLADYAVISGSPEEIAEAFELASAPADTKYPVYGSDEYVKFIAGHLVAGSEFIDVTDFQSVPGAQSFSDAYYEAYYQNPYAVGVPIDRAVRFNPVIGADRSRVIYRLHYSLDDSERSQMQQALADRVHAVIAEVVSDDMSASERAVALNNWLIAHTEYDYEALAQSQTGGEIASLASAWQANGALLDLLAVCLGYAQAYSALMNEAGVETYVVTGEVLSGGSHAWNKVNIDGTWLSVDPTWNDQPGSAANSYLLIHDSQFTAAATRFEDVQWVRDDLVSSFATP
jgi:transglutaminase-like putative cysteine protease